MSTSQTALFTVSGTWTCPAGVTAVWLTISAGGGGSPGSWSYPNIERQSTGGGGSGEYGTNITMSVVPGTVYTVTVGTGGLGTLYHTIPSTTSASSSQFNGVTANFPVNFNTHVTTILDGSNSGGGGGFAAASPGKSGGYDGHFGPNNGANQMGKRESGRWTGGGNGGFGTGPSLGALYPNQVSGYFTSGIGGGTMAINGAGAGIEPFGNYGGGGAGAGTVFGGTNGTNFRAAVTAATASAICYGAGSGGSGLGQDGTPKSVGGNGATGVVMLMWVGP